MKKSQTKRSWFTTITATVIGLVIVVLILPLIPLNDWTEIAFFGFGVLSIILCIVVAIGGKKGTIREIIYSLGFWS